jgi:hypothetical protein
MTDRKPTLKRGDEQLEKDLQVIEQIAERYKDNERAKEVMAENKQRFNRERDNK